MQLKIEKRFLRVPVKYDGKPFRFTLNGEGLEPYWFFAAYEEQEPDAVYWADLRHFLGKTVEMEAPEGFLPFFSDEMEPLSEAEAALRPVLHYTAERGWLNDPNGLFCLDGVYHLYHQHNPFGRTWGNMHWAHAVSRDLFHWEYREEALFQDEFGMMFSGCAVIDRKNVSGLGAGEKPPILFFYTNAGEKRSSQWLAYSTDGGETLQKYGEILPEAVPGNRDPKVVYDAARSRWLMALYFSERTYALYASRDLLHWELLQTFDLLGNDECPDIYALTADDGRVFWVYSGAHDTYFVGDFDGSGRYCPVQEVKQLAYGSASYAAQTYFCEPGKPVIRIAWNRSEIPDAPFNGSMCTPTVMSLKKRGDTYDLCMTPVDSIEALVEREDEIFDCEITSHTVELSRKAVLVDLEADRAPFSLSLFGCVIRADGENVMASDVTLPIAAGEPVSLTVISDTTGFEIYVNGSAFTALPLAPDFSDKRFLFSADYPVRIHSLRVAELSLSASETK